MRSTTACKIYENDIRFEVKSAGTDETTNTVLSEKNTKLGRQYSGNGKTPPKLYPKTLP